MTTKCKCEKAYCTSCLSCVKNCKSGVLYQKISESGFSYIEKRKECNECNNICPQLDNRIKKNKGDLFSAQLIDENELLISTSGGMFSAVAQFVFEKKGIVYGAAFDSNLELKHVSARNMDELKPMHGSKYMLSNAYECFDSIKKELENGLTVMFSGLPCQVAALYSFLGKSYKNLVTVDLICSGVPSQKLFRAYLNYIEKKKNIKILDYKFRDKHKYGVSHTVVITYRAKSNKIKTKTIKDRNRVSYYVAFGKQNCFMDSCYRCKYNSIDRISDITLGGFWSISKAKTSLNERKGVSLVLANTDLGKFIVEWCKRVAVIEKQPIELAWLGNRALISTTPIELQEKELYTSLDYLGYKKTMLKYFKPHSLIHSVLSQLLSSIKNYFKKN